MKGQHVTKFCLKKKDTLPRRPICTVSGSLLPGCGYSFSGTGAAVYTDTPAGGRCLHLLRARCCAARCPPRVLGNRARGSAPPGPSRACFGAPPRAAPGQPWVPLLRQQPLSGLDLCLAERSLPPGPHDTQFPVFTTRGWRDMKDLTENLGRFLWKRDREPAGQGQVLTPESVGKTV